MSIAAKCILLKQIFTSSGIGNHNLYWLPA